MKAIIIINIYIDGRTTDRKSKPGGSRIKWTGKESRGRMVESRKWDKSKGAVLVWVEDKSQADLISFCVLARWSRRQANVALKWAKSNRIKQIYIGRMGHKGEIEREGQCGREGMWTNWQTDWQTALKHSRYNIYYFWLCWKSTLSILQQLANKPQQTTGRRREWTTTGWTTNRMCRAYACACVCVCCI